MILMAMTTYPLNNILYQAEDAELFHCTRTSGVYDNLDFQYSVTGADNNVTIGKGLAWIRNAEFAGKVSANKQPIVLDLGLTSSVLPRIDAIVIQFDANKNATSIIVKKGEEASKPQPPKVVRTESTYELHLYHVLRKPTDATITKGVITDLRTNYDYCGIMLDDISRIDQTLAKDGFAADSGVVGRKLEEKISKSKITPISDVVRFNVHTNQQVVTSYAIKPNTYVSITVRQLYASSRPKETIIKCDDLIGTARIYTPQGEDSGSVTASFYSTKLQELQIIGSAWDVGNNAFYITGFMIEV